MKKNFKRTLAKVMAVALTVSMLGVSANDADAAKKIKLSSKSISVVKGKTKKVTIKNVKAKKVKKLTVKSANKKVAIVKKSGKTAIKVTGKKAGKSTKVTVKVTVGKKTTKLTLKVKVTKAKAPAKTAAPATSATPVASASATPVASASATPAASTDPSATPAASTDPSATPVASASATPDVTPVASPSATPKEYDVTKEDMSVALTEANASKWTLEGNYGQVKFNADGTVSFSSQPTAEEDVKDADGNPTGEKKLKDVSVYNNGASFYLGADAETKTDVSDYHYVSIRIKTEAELKFMTWTGGDDADNFWDKSDTWGSTVDKIKNADGSETIVYEVPTVFGKKANKAKAVGFTLKSPAADGSDSDPGVAQEGTLYSIVFSNTMPVADAGDIETGNVETGNVETGNVETGNVETGSTETGSTETPVVEEPVVKEINVALKNANIYTVGDLIDADAKDVYVGTEGEDGSISFKAKNANWGGGMSFYFNEDKSAVDMKKYSAIKVTLSAEESTPIVGMLFKNSAPENYLYSKTYDWNEYKQYNQASTTETEITFDLSKVVDLGDAYAFGIKYNGYPNGLDSMTEEQKAEEKAKTASIKIKSIKLIPKE